MSSSVVSAAISNKFGVGPPTSGPRAAAACGNRGPIFLCAAKGSNPADRLGSAPNRRVGGRSGESNGLGRPPPRPRRPAAAAAAPGRGELPSGSFTPGRGEGNPVIEKYMNT